MMAVRIDFQSEAFSPSRMQMPSRAILTTGGGLPMERISTRSFFLIPFTAACGPRAIQNVLTTSATASASSYLPIYPACMTVCAYLCLRGAGAVGLCGELYEKKGIERGGSTKH